MDSRGRAADEAEKAFGGLYAACGLPAPAVVVFPTEAAYRQAARAASVHDRPADFLGLYDLGWPLEAARHVVCPVLSVLSLCALLFRWWSGNLVPDFIAAQAVLAAAAAPAWLLSHFWRLREYGKLYAAVEGSGLRETPGGMLAMLSSAAGYRKGPGPAPPAGQMRFLDGCLRLGSVRILRPSRAPFLNHLDGADLRPVPGMPRLLALAGAASATVDEALLTRGLVMALAPGAAAARLAPLPASLPDASPVRSRSGGGRARFVRRQAVRHLFDRACEMGPDAAEAVLRELGLQRVVDVLGLDPVSADSSGHDYRLLLDRAPRRAFAGPGRFRVLPEDAMRVRALRAAEMEPRLAEPILREIGLQRAVDAMGLAPIQEDGAGRFYRLSPDGVLCAVRVRDRVAGADGTPLIHWMFVPPHVVTAREGVAWSFGLSEAEYAPTAES